MVEELGIFSSLGSWDKYRRSMEGVRKCRRRYGEMCWGVEKCGGRKG